MEAEADGPDRTFRTSPTATPVTCHPTLSFAASVVEVVGFGVVVVSGASVIGGEVFDTGVVDGVVAFDGSVGSVDTPSTAQEATTRTDPTRRRMYLFTDTTAPLTSTV
jgi:hypothetical protein